MPVEKPYIPPPSPDLSSLPCCRAAVLPQCLRVKCARAVSFFLGHFPSTLSIGMLLFVTGTMPTISPSIVWELCREMGPLWSKPRAQSQGSFKTAYYIQSLGCGAPCQWGVCGQTSAVLKYLNISYNKCPPIFFFWNSGENLSNTMYDISRLWQATLCCCILNLIRTLVLGIHSG